MHDTILKEVGIYCRFYRMYELNMTLRDVQGNEKIKSLSSFEHGHSSNIKHLFKYLIKCDNDTERINFLIGLIRHVRSNINWE